MSEPKLPLEAESVPSLESPTVPAAESSAVESDYAVIMRQARANVVANALQKTGLGVLAGVTLSLGLFKRRLAPVFLCTGFGMGLAWEQGDRVIKTVHEEARQAALK